jgi:hypothetical protein
VTITEPDPTLAFGGEPEVGVEGWRTDGEQHDAARLCPGLQPAHRAGAETAKTLAGDDHIESVDHRRQHVVPLRITRDHHQPLQRQPHLGRGADTELGQAGHADPRPFLRRSHRQRHRQRHTGPATTRHRRAALQGQQQPGK